MPSMKCVQMRSLAGAQKRADGTGKGSGMVSELLAEHENPLSATPCPLTMP